MVSADPQTIDGSTNMRKRLRRNAKTTQGFELHPPRCLNCRHFVPPAHGVPERASRKGQAYKDPRCGLGAFIVRPDSICDAWTGKHGETLEA